MIKEEDDGVVGFFKGTINGVVIKSGGSDKWGWALVRYREDDMRFGQKLLIAGAGDVASKLAGYNPGSPITATGRLESRKDKETGQYKMQLIVKEVAGGKAKATAADEDMPF